MLFVFVCFLVGDGKGECVGLIGVFVCDFVFGDVFDLFVVDWVVVLWIGLWLVVL